MKQSARVLLTGSHFQFAGAVAWELLEVYYQEIANKSAQRQKKGKEATASFN